MDLLAAARRAGLALGCTLALSAPPAAADGAGDVEAPPPRRGAHHRVAPLSRDAVALPRRTVGGPGYVGSDWGLGKPSYSGIGTRPDGGFSGD